MGMLKIILILCMGITCNLNCKCADVDYSYRLPTTIKPRRYNVTLEPALVNDMSLLKFHGSIIIEIDVLAATNNITFHVRNITIDVDSITIVDVNETKIEFSNTTVDTKREFYIINFEEELLAGNSYKMILKSYHGNAGDQTRGFYLAKYKDAQNRQRYLALTDFESSDARQAFPCFDEPQLKATFIINLIRTESYHSVSNEELITSVNLGNGRYQDTFKETVTMSTYLVAFAISDYKWTARKDRIRIFARSEAIDKGRADYVLPKSGKLLKALEEYTGINYALTKMDLLAAPNDYFLDGAMENWGLVIFKEKYLLCSNISSTTEDLQTCTLFTAHELAHQWFGNLVTPKWWNYLWLGEGFASYFQYHISAVVEPSWRLEEQYVVDSLLNALRNDFPPITEPMNANPVLQDFFPSPYVYYYKASAVIRMARHFLSESTFKNGLRIYLKKHQFTATEPSDLYSAFQQAADEAGTNQLGGLQISDILTSWDSNIGYPLITVERNYETGIVTLSQEMYMSDNETKSNSVWYIPINYKFHLDNSNFSKTTADFWLTHRTGILDDNFTTDSWLLLNKQFTGYYRINYDIINWKRLAEFLNTEEFVTIPPLNRAQLLEDSFSLANEGKLPYEIPLNLSTYLMKEVDFIPLSVFSHCITKLDVLLSTSEVADIVRDYAKDLLRGAASFLGYEETRDDTHIDKLNRALVVKLMCTFGDSECANIGLKILRLWQRTQNNTISPDLQFSLLCGAIKIATKDDWNFLYQQYVLNKDVEFKFKFLGALGCSNNREILTNYLDIICNNENAMPTSDRIKALQSIADSSKASLNVLFEYVVNNATPCRIGSLPEDFAFVLITPKQAEQLDEFRSKTGIDDLPLQFSLEDSNETGALPEIRDWLLQYNQIRSERYNVI